MDIVINIVGAAFKLDYYRTSAMVISKAVVVIGPKTTAIRITAIVIKDFIDQN